MSVRARFASSSLLAILSACAADSTDPVAIQTVEQALVSEQTYLVVYKLPVPALTANSDVRGAGGTVVASYPYGVVVAKSSAADFASKLSRKLLVQSVAATGGAGIAALPGSVNYNPFRYLPSAPAPSPNSEQLADMQWNMKQIRADGARAITRGRRSVVVGVLDSGIDDSVPDLNGQVDNQRSVTCVGGAPNGDRALWSNDWIGHGTHVAGIIAAKDDGLGVVGVAPGVSLAAINVVNDDALIYPEAFLCGLHWAATHDIQLVNASLILDPWYYYCPSDPVQATITTAVQRAVRDASLKGTTVVAAAGNEGFDLANKTVDAYTEEPVSNACKLLPAEADGVITVSATGGTGTLAYYSNYGYNVVDVAAPGGDFNVPVTGNASGQIVSSIPSTSFFYDAAIDWNGRVATGCPEGFDPNAPDADPSQCAATFAVLQGSSQATPHVTGVAALVISRFGNVGSTGLLANFSRTAKETACTQLDGATCTGSKSYNGFYGYGVIDAARAVQGL
jgi:lantibiotic leader peptide-processing serine protease